MTLDMVKEAARALRIAGEETTGDIEVEAARRKIVARVQRRAEAKRVLIMAAMVLGVMSIGSTAWAAVTGRLPEVVEWVEGVVSQGTVVKATRRGVSDPNHAESDRVALTTVPCDTPTETATLAWHLAEAGSATRAVPLVLVAQPRDETEARAWARAADSVLAALLATDRRHPRRAGAGSTAELRLAAARIHELAGNAARALSVLAPLLRTRPRGALGARVHARIGAACLAVGDAARAIRHLLAALARAAAA
jgi:hypothetical protein